MTHAILGEPFEDDRGVIQDLITGQLTSVTRISTVAGAIRGNHVHDLTTQWTYVLSGALLMADGISEIVIGPGEIVAHHAGVPHAWKALEDTDCLVFTLGPRGEDYESDTERLQEPLLA
jgi:quercetin dioxygenase-like cupin family protein